ncbi:cytochrome P450 [Cubamyces lactineus]|nr:cytochrome P450 [Cubamyces lactineus]
MEQLTDLGPRHLVLALAASVLLLTIYKAVTTLRSRARRYPLPPGPRRLPIIGNLLHAPRHHLWLGFKDLCTKYGDLVYLNILGNHLIIVGSARLVTELLEKRSRNTSDRPFIPVAPLVGNDAAFSIMPYGQQWRDHRRAFWQIFHPAATRGYREIQSEKLRTFLAALLNSPQNFQQHIRYNFSATVMKLLYDLDAKEKDDEFIARVEESMALTSEHLTGSHPVDVFPFLRHLPGWVPGAGFQYEFARCKAAVTYVKEAPFALMKAAMSRGESVSCSLATLLSRIGGQSTDAEVAYREEIIKNVGLIAFEGA